MTCCVGANTFLAQGKHGREDPVAFVCWTVLLISSKHRFLRHLNDKVSLVWAPPGGQKSSIAFKFHWGQNKDKHTTGPSLSALMKSTILRMVCVCNSKARVCLSLVLMDRAEKRDQEGEIEQTRFQRLNDDSSWVTARDWSFWNPTLHPEELVQVVDPQCFLGVAVCVLTSSKTLRRYCHLPKSVKREVNPDVVLPPSGPLCCSTAVHRDLKHLGLMGRRVVKRGEIMVRMFLLTLQTPGVGLAVCTSNLWNGFADWVVTAWRVAWLAGWVGWGVAADCVDAALGNVNN